MVALFLGPALAARHAPRAFVSPLLSRRVLSRSFLHRRWLHDQPPGPVDPSPRPPLAPSSLPDASPRSTTTAPPTGRALKEDIYTIPNMLTISRIVSCPIIAYAIVQGHFGLATSLLGLAGVTDWVDGFVARRYNMQTVLGTILDPAADKALMTTLVLSLTYKGLLPLPLAAIILGRDVIFSLTAFYLRFITIPKPRTWKAYWDMSAPSVQVIPTQISKVNTFLQLVLMGSTTVMPLLSADLSVDLTVFQYTVGATTIYSGLSYLWTKGAVRILPRS